MPQSKSCCMACRKKPEKVKFTPYEDLVLYQPPNDRKWLFLIISDEESCLFLKKYLMNSEEFTLVRNPIYVKKINERNSVEKVNGNSYIYFDKNRWQNSKKSFDFFYFKSLRKSNFLNIITFH